MLVLMLLQTVIEVVYYFLLPKFIEECNRLLPDRAADSTICMGRMERPRKTKVGTEEAHVTHDSDTTFRVKRSKGKVTRPL